jgi:hypothetical protein
MVAPEPAFASIADDINSWLCGILRDTCNWIFNSQVNVLKSIGTNGVLSASFDQMLGGAGGVTMYDVVHGVWEAAILPIGCGVLSFVFTIQLIKISQKMDGNAAMPGVKEVVFLLVFYAVFLFLLKNSFDIMQAVYEVSRIAIQRVYGPLRDGLGHRPQHGFNHHSGRQRRVAPGHARGSPRELGRRHRRLRRGAGGELGQGAADLHHGRLLPDPAVPARRGRDAPDGRGLPAQLRIGMPRRRDHPRAPRELPDRARRAQRRKRRACRCSTRWSAASRTPCSTWQCACCSSSRSPRAAAWARDIMGG